MLVLVSVLCMEKEMKEAKPDRKQQLQETQAKRMRGHNKTGQNLSPYWHPFGKPEQTPKDMATALCRPRMVRCWPSTVSTLASMFQVSLVEENRILHDVVHYF